MTLPGTYARLLSLLAGLAFAAAAPAQEPASAYPSKPVKVLVGFSPGTGSDAIARQTAALLQKQLGGTFIVENVTGASGMIAQQHAARAAPDGYTLLLTSAGPLTLAPAVGKVPFDPIKDYAPIGGIAIFPMVLVVAPTHPANTVQELIDRARAKPSEVAYASSGVGLTGHMSSEMLAMQSGVKFTHVPYKGATMGMSDLMAGRVDFMFDTPIATLGLIRDGRLKPLAVGTPTRAGSLPNVPTIAESGFPGFSATSWMILVAPAKTPAPIVERLGTALKQSIEAPDMRSALQKMEVEPMPMTPAETSAFIRRELDKWTEIARKAQVKQE